MITFAAPKLPIPELSTALKERGAKAQERFERFQKEGNNVKTEERIVAIVGIGALGSHVVEALRNEDVVISVIDFDRVETKNILSQFHAKSHVGKAKTESLKQTMLFLFSRKVISAPYRLTAVNAETLLGKAALVIDCLDNPESRQVVRDFCSKAKIQVLHGALAANGGFGRVDWNENFQIEQGNEGIPTCEDGEMLPFIMLVSSIIALAAKAFLRTGSRVGYAIGPNGTVMVL
jgi:molybdopterin/thiamine biosynthesis adenylyltransferase